MFRLSQLAVAGASLFLLVACDNASTGFAGFLSQSKTPEQQLAGDFKAYFSSKAPKLSASDTASPDAVVKAVWRVLAVSDGFQTTTCPLYVELATPVTGPEFRALATQELMDKVDKSVARYPCRATTVSRAIDEVKVESETRAAVYATAKQTFPVPTMFYDEKTKKLFEEGQKLKYIVEKVEGQWRISEMYYQDQYKNFAWTAFTFEDLTPDPGFVSAPVNY